MDNQVVQLTSTSNNNTSSNAASQQQNTTTARNSNTSIRKMDTDITHIITVVCSFNSSQAGNKGIVEAGVHNLDNLLGIAYNHVFEYDDSRTTKTLNVVQQNKLLYVIAYAIYLEDTSHADAKDPTK